MTVLVAPDKFKGSLTADQVASAIAAGLAEAGVQARCLPLADGGDGSVTAALAAGFDRRTATASGANGQAHEATYALRHDVAVVEVASTCGLATLPGGRLAPMASSSLGFGHVVRAAARDGASTVVLALGGSASTDCGAGMLAALGVRFLDERAREVVPCGGNLTDIVDLDLSELEELSGVELIVATDVHNPLLGADGAAATFGPQKGATPDQVNDLEAGLAHLAALLQRNPPPWAPERPGPVSLAEQAGTGAAGGLGFASLWLGAHRVAGADYFLELLGFDAAVEDCEAVITGEGSLDGQTVGGKLPSAVAARSGSRPVYAVVGRAELTDDERDELGIHDIRALVDLTQADPSKDPALSRALATVAGRQLGELIVSRTVPVSTTASA